MMLFFSNNEMVRNTVARWMCAPFIARRREDAESGLSAFSKSDKIIILLSVGSIPLLCN